MTQVYLAPWLLMMSPAALLGDWLVGVRTDHAYYFLFLGSAFLLIDALRWAARVMRKRWGYA